MSLFIILLWMIVIPFLPYSSHAQPKGQLITCGSTEKQTIQETNLTYIPDDDFIKVGNKTVIDEGGLLPILTTVRYFPSKGRKFCYTFQVTKGDKYLVRTIYFYGGFDGGKHPPVFDQIIGGTRWSVVNTTEDYANGLSSYYEIIVGARSETLSVCLARNNQTDSNSSPFISAIELLTLEDSMYNSTDFSTQALVTVARTSFGDEDSISYPDDPYYRLWQPFTDKENEVVSSKTRVSTSDFWNKPPAEAFVKAITTGPGKNLDVTWPPWPLPNTKYYISLYFQDNRTANADAWRVFSVAVNGKPFYNKLNVSTSGVTVYSPGWPLSGQTKISLNLEDKSSVGPLINAGEIYQILPFGEGTLPEDAMAMQELANSFNDPPADWVGDPCLPIDTSWTGVSCSYKDTPRVISMDLSNLGISGTLHPAIDTLTELHHLWLGGNNISGSIPEMSSLKQLETLRLDNNKLTGKIPQSLGTLNNLRELFLQNNNLDGLIPDTLVGKNGLDLQVSPGTPLSNSNESGSKTATTTQIPNENGAETGTEVPKENGVTTATNDPNPATKVPNENEAISATNDPDPATKVPNENGATTATNDPYPATIVPNENGAETAMVDPNAATNVPVENGAETATVDPNPATNVPIENGAETATKDPNPATNVPIEN